MLSNLAPWQDRLSFDHAMVAEPVWNKLESARSAVSLDRRVLLHAGPSFRSDEEISKPILNSACVAAVYEGIADDLDKAEKAILAGDIVLRPAQDCNVVTPLAAVVSASMLLHVVYDAHRGRTKSFAPINGGSGPAARLGLRSMEVVEHLKWLNGDFASFLDDGIAEGIGLVPIARESLRNGDDCHGRTPFATSLLVNELVERSPYNTIDKHAQEFAHGSPSLFLNLWMAATKCAMLLAENIEGSSMVTAAGGNGNQVGIQLSATGKRWFTMPATPPVGSLDIDVPTSRSLGAIGDSAIVDAFGLGAMAFHLSPQQMSAMGRFLPAELPAIRRAVMLGDHVGFRGVNVRLGLSCRRVVETGMTPCVSLGILDATGELGRLGGGIYQMPLEIFKIALTALDTSQ